MSTSAKAPARPSLLKSTGRNVEWERRVLDCALLVPALWAQLSDLMPEFFFLERHQQIYDAMRKTDQISRVNLYDVMRAKKQEVIYAEFEAGELYPRSDPAEFNYYLGRMRTEHEVRKVAHDMDRMLTAIAAGEGIAIEEIRRLGESLPTGSMNGDTETEVSLKAFEQIDKEHLRWLWPKYLPLGRLIHLAGDSGHGKSPLTLDLIARISAGMDWPDGTKNTAGPRAVILLSAEDDVGDTVRPRLEVAGADLSRVYDVRCTFKKRQNSYEKLLALDRDTQQLLVRAREIRDLGAIWIDPVTNYLGDAQMKQEEEIRKLLMPISAAAADMNILAATAGHLNRREKGTAPLQRIMGAAAFHGIARVVYIVGADPEDQDKHAHVLVQQRGFAAPALRYATITKPLTWDGITDDVIQIEWRGASQASGQEAVDPAADSEKTATASAATDLLDLLEKEGKLASEEAKKLLGQAGHDISPVSWSRILRRAGAKSKRFPGERYYSCFLPAKGEK